VNEWWSENGNHGFAVANRNRKCASKGKSLQAAAESIRKPIPHTKVDQPSQLPHNDAKNGGAEDLPSLNTDLGYIKWYLAEGHPLRPWLIANRLAEEKLDPPFELSNDWSVKELISLVISLPNLDS
jgi:hypothetical protein